MAVEDLLAIDEARSAVNLPSGATQQDGELKRYLTGLSRRVDDLCGPVVIRTITDEEHDGGVHRIWLRKSPADSVTSVSEWLNTTETALTAETRASQPADAYLHGHTGPLHFIRRRNTGSDARFPTGRQNVLVTYEAGRYASTADVDELFKLTAASILRRIWKREASSWSQSTDFVTDTEGATPQRSFFRVVDPMIKEFLADELLPPGMGV